MLLWDRTRDLSDDRSFIPPLSGRPDFITSIAKVTASVLVSFLYLYTKNTAWISKKSGGRTGNGSKRRTYSSALNVGVSSDKHTLARNFSCFF